MPVRYGVSKSVYCNETFEICCKVPESWCWKEGLHLSMLQNARATPNKVDPHCEPSAGSTGSSPKTIRWYVIHCKVREEQRALGHLQRQGFECYLPMVPVEKCSRGRKLEIPEPLFPRYLFIKLGKAEENWYAIRSTRGVSELVCCNGKPVAIRDEIIEGIRERLATQLAPDQYFKPGDPVRIIEGAFSELEAIFVANDDVQSVMLLLSILQQDQKLSFPLRSVRKLR